MFGVRAPEKRVVLDALLPEVLALVAAVEEELHCVFVVALRGHTKFSCSVWILHIFKSHLNEFLTLKLLIKK